MRIDVVNLQEEGYMSLLDLADFAILSVFGEM